MRLARRRRRSLHDLDVGNASYSTFEDGNRPTENARNLNDWLDSINDQARRTENARRRRTARASPTDDPELLTSLIRQGTTPVRSHPVNNAGYLTLQLTQRVPDAAMANFQRLEDAIRTVEQIITRRMQNHIERQHPGQSGLWEYHTDLTSDIFNQEQVFTITARRPR